mgnify:CR=1 FL=1
MCDYQSLSDSHNTIELHANSYDGGTLSIIRNDILYMFDVTDSQFSEFWHNFSDESVKCKQLDFDEGMRITIKHQKKGIALVECTDGNLSTLFRFNLAEMGLLES